MAGPDSDDAFLVPRKLEQEPEGPEGTAQTQTAPGPKTYKDYKEFLKPVDTGFTGADSMTEEQKRRYFGGKESPSGDNGRRDVQPTPGTGAGDKRLDPSVPPSREDLQGQLERNFQEREAQRKAEIEQRIEEDRKAQESGRPPETSDRLLWGSGSPHDIKGAHKHNQDMLSKLSDSDLKNIGSVAGELSKSPPDFRKAEEIIRKAFDGNNFDAEKLSNFMDGLRLQMERLGKNPDFGMTSSPSDGSAWVHLAMRADGTPMRQFKLESSNGSVKFEEKNINKRD